MDPAINSPITYRHSMFTELPSHRNRYAMLQMCLLLLEGFPPFRLVVTLARIDEPSTVPDEMLVFFLPCSLHPPMLYLKTSITPVLVISSTSGTSSTSYGRPEGLISISLTTACTSALWGKMARHPIGTHDIGHQKKSRVLSGSSHA